MESISKSINEFSLDIFKEIDNANKNSNILFSPVSITSSLSLVLLGAKGDTAYQIEKVLHFSDEEDASGSEKASELERTSSDECEQKAFQSEQTLDVHIKLKALFNNLMSGGDTELKIANGLFTQVNFPISEEYRTSTQALYKANLKSVDFHKDKTRENINKWVETETKGKITNLFAPRSLDKNASLVLVNCIYFHGEWMKKFKKENTKNAPFYVKKDVQITVPMMSQTERFQFGIIEEIDAQVIELPYGKGDMSMIILLPNEITGLEKLKQQITLESLVKWTDSKTLSNTKLEVQIPRFKIQESYDLSQYLKDMGIVDAFSQQNADLSGISDVGLTVSKVVHKAYIEVNEEGTEAAAATGIVIVPKSLLPPLQFIANHPFLCFIKHKASNTFLFFLKVQKPSL
ncbi:leukocyte elastase inhibitor-like [Hyperolius riggenbachi]|uniref:leukocyte elastase inhibitor-like n=1 Tax=Hyperolius riggenbachi TaxID=752182 RepID=UPI0035A2DCF1